MLSHGWLAAAKGNIRIVDERGEHGAEGFAEAWKLWMMLSALTQIQGILVVCFMSIDKRA